MRVRGVPVHARCSRALRMQTPPSHERLGSLAEMTGEEDWQAQLHGTDEWHMRWTHMRRVARVLSQGVPVAARCVCAANSAAGI